MLAIKSRNKSMKNVTELSSACDEKVVIMVSREGKVMCMNGNDEGMFVALQLRWQKSKQSKRM